MTEKNNPSNTKLERALREAPYDRAAAEVFQHLCVIAATWLGNKEKAGFCARAAACFRKRHEEASSLIREASARQVREQRKAPNVERVARQLAKELGYTPKYMAGVLQGRRHGASPILIRKLARMGITTVAGEKL